MELRDVPGYEALYAVTADGRVWSHRKQGWLLPRVVNGYQRVELRGKEMKVHRLVALAWIANPDGLPLVNHLDGVKTHNRVENLEWCTKSDNAKHAVRTGLTKVPQALKGSAVAISKLTEQAVAVIKARLQRGDKQADIAADNGVTQPCISLINRNKMWNHVLPAIHGRRD